MKKQLFRAGLLLGIIVWGISAIFFISHPGNILELKALDYLFYLRGDVAFPENIIIVAIDEASFGELKLSWPWPRNLHARLIRKLMEAGAKIIGLDILFADPGIEEDDTALAQAIKEAGNVVLASDIDIVEEYGYKQVTEIGPIPIFRDVSRGVGSCTLIYDPDNIIRRARLKFGKITSFVYELLRLYGADLRLLIDKLDKDILINFVGPIRSIKTVSYYQVLNYKNYLPEDIFRDKIVLVGRSLTASPSPMAKQPDIFSIPRFPNHKAQIAGIEIIANFIDTILRNRYIKEFPKKYIYIALLPLFLILSMIEVRISYLVSLGLTILSTILYGLFAYFCFAYNNVFFPAFMPTTGIWLIFGTSSLTKYFLAEQEKRYIKDAFQKYVPPSVVKKILEAPEKLRLGGEEVTGTVLFSDLERFTTVSEKFSPERLVSFINEYLSEMSDIIFRYHGTITRFIGDAILAVWGAPVWHQDHALRAVLSALEMRDKLRELNIEWKIKGLPELKVRIGLNTGAMIVGNVGSKQHIDYTAMGDSVNLASRLEEANKFYGTNIIIGQSTYRLIDKVIDCRLLDLVKVKGREEPLEIYEPVKHKKKHQEEMDRFLYLYKMGYENERKRLWSEAIKDFSETLSISLNDLPAKMHLERCINYKENPPPADWDGVHILTEK